MKQVFTQKPYGESGKNTNVNMCISVLVRLNNSFLLGT